jgi:hypothetical protein
MAEVKTIKINVETNAKNVAQDMKDVTASTNQAAASVENLGATTQEAGNKGKVFTDIKNVFTGMVPGLKKAEGGVTSFGASLKALLANPVVLVLTAIVGTLKFIYEAFQSNVKIGKEIAAVWAGISAVGTQVTDAVMGMVRGIVYAGSALYKFVTGDVKGAAAAMKKANDEMSTSYNQLTKAVNGTTLAVVRGLEKQQQANNKAKKEQAVRESEINKLLVQSREILTDETASIKEKKKALEEVTKAEKASAAEKVRTAAVDLKILEQKAKALGGQAEVKMKQQIREATIALNEAETENAMTGIKLNRQRKMLVRQEISEGKEAAAAAKERAKEKIAAEQELLKNKQDAIDKIRKAEQDYADSLLSEQEREKIVVKRKYEELYKEAEKFGLDTKKLKEAEAGENLKIEEKYQAQRQKIIEDANKKANDLRIQAENEFQAQIEAIDEANFQAGLQKSMTENEYEIELVRQKYFTLEEAAKGNADQLAIITEAKNRELGVIQDKQDKKEKEAAKAVADYKAALVDQGLNTALQGVKLVASLFEKQKGVQKAAVIAESAIGIAKMIIANKQANVAALATPQAVLTSGAAATPVIAMNNITTGMSIIANLAATRKALQTLGGGSPPSADNPSGGGGGGAAGGSMSPNFNVVGNSGINQLAQLQQTPVQAYVVSGSVTTAQSLDRNRIENATL